MCLACNNCFVTGSPCGCHSCKSKLGRTGDFHAGKTRKRSAVLDIGDKLVNWVNDVKEYALSEALKGREWEGWKVVEGKSNRKFTDTDIVADQA